MADLVPLVEAEEIASLTSADDGPALARAVEAAVVVSALVRSYTRSAITVVADDIAVLTGTRSRRLLLGERPVLAVSSVTVDGKVLEDYRWHRSGALWRNAGWYSLEHEVVVIFDHGFAQVPADLRAVCRSAAGRMVANPEGWRSTSLEVPGQLSEQQVAATPHGFTPTELMVLNRYRRRVWP